LIEEGLRIAVAEHCRVATAERILPRVSKATGGPMPGVDLADSSTLQEIEDLSYVGRMTHFK
jgi:hypothetical protein